MPSPVAKRKDPVQPARVKNLVPWNCYQGIIGFTEAQIETHLKTTAERKECFLVVTGCPATYGGILFPNFPLRKGVETTSLAQIHVIPPFDNISLSSKLSLVIRPNDPRNLKIIILTHIVMTCRQFPDTIAKYKDIRGTLPFDHPSRWTGYPKKSSVQFCHHSSLN